MMKNKPGFERREAVRINSFLPAMLSYIGSHKEIPSTILDISLTGQCCLLESPLPPDIDVVQITVEKQGILSETESVVTWRDDSNKKYGLQFIRHYPQTSALIQNILSGNSSNKSNGEYAWVEDLQEFIKPYWDKILSSPCVQGTATGTLPLEQMRGWILQLYPFIHTFPKFLAESLTKVEDEKSREFLIDNIRVEKEHAKHWIWMGMGFGLSKKEMIGIVYDDQLVLRDVQSLTDWLWHINTKGSLAEAVAATSFAIEGVTGDISRKVVDGLSLYQGREGVSLSERTLKWMREHAHYDDLHPKIALEVVKHYAKTEQSQKKVMFAARRSLQLLELALDTAYRAYAPSVQKDYSINADRRELTDRRLADTTIRFPNRRFREQRGNPYSFTP